MKISAAFLFTITLLTASCNQGNKKIIPILKTNTTNNSLTIAETIAYKNGLEKFDQLEQIDFTFNVDRGENHFERSWQWRPKENNVTYIKDKDTISFNRNAVDSITMRYDASFINDKYWLLAPFNLVWDEGLTISEPKKEIAPLSRQETNVLTITYGDKGGYTPGDAYDLYYGNDFMLQEWVFRKGNDTVPSMITTWEAYKDYNGLNIATMHKDSLGDFKLYFTGIKIH